MNLDSKSIEQYVELIKQNKGDESEDPYTYSSLPQYFQLDTWSVTEGILLISGINPDEALIDFSQCNELGAQTNKVKIKAAQPLNIIQDIYDYPRLETIRNDIEEMWSDLYDYRLKLASNPPLHEEENLSSRIKWVKGTIEDYEGILEEEDIKAVELIREHYDLKIGRILKVWLSTTGHHDNNNDQSLDERHPKEYFFNWAKEKNIKIDWLDWAIENNYYTDESIKSEHNDKSLDPREKTTWSRIVKALCLELKIPLENPYTAATEIQRIAAKHRVHIAAKDQTIAKRIKEINEE